MLPVIMVQRACFRAVRVLSSNKDALLPVSFEVAIWKSRLHLHSLRCLHYGHYPFT